MRAASTSSTSIPIERIMATLARIFVCASCCSGPATTSTPVRLNPTERPVRKWKLA
jgi:hypothetical protein